MKLTEARKLAKELIAEHCPEYKFKFDNAKARYGLCNYKTKTISLSKPNTKINDIEVIRNTILHEIAHALTKGHHHNYIWKSKALQIGCNAERGTRANVVQGKYKYTCPKCKRIVTFHRRLKREVSCGDCCSHFSRDCLLEEI